MKGRETSMSLLTSNLFYLYEGPRDLHKPPEQGICSTYMKGPETSMKPPNKGICLPI